MLIEQIKFLLDTCELEGNVKVELEYDELSKVYSALVAMKAYESTLTECLMSGYDKV